MNTQELMQILREAEEKEHEPVITESQLKAGTERVTSSEGFRIIEKINPQKDRILGLWTAGVSTCTAVAGFFTSKDGVYGLFLAHILPGNNQMGVFDALPGKKIDRLSYTVIHGPSDPSRIIRKTGISNINPKSFSNLDYKLQQDGIKVNPIPYTPIRRISSRYTRDAKYYQTGLDATFGVIVKLEKVSGIFVPKITEVMGG